MTQYQKVLLSNVDKVEFGAVESGAFNIAFGRNQTRNEHSMRIWYRMPSEGRKKSEMNRGYPEFQICMRHEEDWTD